MQREKATAFLIRFEFLIVQTQPQEAVFSLVVRSPRQIVPHLRIPWPKPCSLAADCKDVAPPLGGKKKCCVKSAFEVSRIFCRRGGLAAFGA